MSVDASFCAIIAGMKLRNLFFSLLLLLSCFSLAQSKEPQTQDTSMFASVQAEPVDKQNFKVHYNIPKEGDIGSEQPPTILYYPKDSKGYVEGMAVTDLSLCKTNDQKTTCQLFIKMLSQRPWDIGTDVTDTRISGSDYRTAFLETIDSVQVSNVDSFVAFIGADSQDPPSSEIV